MTDASIGVTALSSEARQAPRRAGIGRRLGTWLFALAVTLALLLGWQQRGEEHLTAESGLGYALGIIGATMMLLLFVYPLRKRLKFMRRWGAMAAWFRLHMLFGILGPSLILFHANFKLGSTNSSIALMAMLLVVASGIIGRFIYSKIHYGLYGRRATLADLRKDVESLRVSLGGSLSEANWVEMRLTAFERDLLMPVRGVLASTWLLATIGFRARRLQRSILHSLKPLLAQEARQHGWRWRTRRRHWKALCNAVRHYLWAVRKVAGFVFYERLFALWHILHVPLFVILFLAAVTHIVAVHLY